MTFDHKLMKHALSFLLTGLFLSVLHADTVWLDDLSLYGATQDWGNPQENRSLGGNPLKIAGKVFSRGLGTQARFWLPITLGGGGLSVSGSVGMDDEAGKTASEVEFVIRGDDNKELWRSGEMKAGMPAKDFSINISGLQTVVMEVTHAADKNQKDHADWANVKFDTTPGQPLTTLEDFKPPWTPIRNEIALSKLGAVTGVQKTADGLILQNQQGGMKVTVCSPYVFRIQATKGGDLSTAPKELPSGKFPIKTDFETLETKEAIALKTAVLQLIIARDTGSISLLDCSGKPLLKEHRSGIQIGKGGKGYTLEMGLGKEEHIFGHGDVVGVLDHRAMKNIQMAVEYRPRNVCTPFFMSTGGYGMFLNDASQSLRFDYFGDKPDGYYTASSQDGVFDCFLIGGGDLKQIIGNYTSTVVGHAPLIPRYGFGVAWSMPSGCKYDQAMQVASLFREKDLPLDSIQFEPGPGYAAYLPKADEKTEKETLEALAALHYHVAAWTGHYPHFWKDHQQWLDWGLNWVKVDPAGRNYHSNESQDADAFTMMEEFKELSHGRRPFISDCAGSTLATLHPSIRMCDRAGRPSTWRSMLSTAMTGIPYFFCDYWCTKRAGLYPGMPDDPTMNPGSRETIPQNLFLPTANGQSWSSTYVLGFPWTLGEEWMNAYRYYGKLRYLLLPYYYSCAADCSLFSGIPMTRPLALEFNNDPKTYAINDDEFMFGDSLLVAPASAEMKGSRDVYLPIGADWIDYWSGKKFKGGQSVKLTIPEHGAEHLCGLYVRAGAIIPMGPEVTFLGASDSEESVSNKQLLLDIYPHGKSAFQLYEDDGSTMNYTKGEYCLTKIECDQQAETTTVTIYPRIGSYHPIDRYYLLKINEANNPGIVTLNDQTLVSCNSYQELVAAPSGWFFGQGDPLIHGPSTFTFPPRPNTLWLKIPDSGKLMRIQALP
jgi:alpha-glucosidase (family GH31 glycosyl hydrolase)